MAQETCCIEEITPSMAEEYLKLVDINTRPVNKRHVEGLAKAMVAGLWKLNGQALIFSSNNQCLDGKHRLHACMMSGKPFRTFVHRGISSEVFHTMDDGVRRSASDVLHQMGFENHKAIAPAARLLCCFRDERFYAGELKSINKSDIKECATNHGRELNASYEFVKGAGVIKNVLSPSYAVFSYLVFARQDKDKAQAFFRGLALGANLELDSPVLQLKNRLVDNQTKFHTLRDILGATFKAWVWYREGKPLSKLGLRADEDFWNIAVPSSEKSSVA